MMFSNSVIEVSSTGITQGHLELLLPPNSPDSHQTQRLRILSNGFAEL